MILSRLAKNASRIKLMIIQQINTSNNDEFYTPTYAVEPILKYVPKNTTIWLPFDTPKSKFLELFKARGNKVITTHIDTGTDFFNCPIPNCNYIVSNPPYSKKLEVFERLFEIDIPFAMLVGVSGLFDSKKKAELFGQNNFEIMYLNPRVSYHRCIDQTDKPKSPAFQSCYVTSKVLHKQIIFENIYKNTKRGKQ